MKSYFDFVNRFAELTREARNLPLQGFAPPEKPSLAPGAPKALFFSPHPDDECISGGPALRLLREARMDVSNVAVTQGSKKERQAERFKELQGACDYLGFGLIATGPAGLEKISSKTRQSDPRHWNNCVQVIASIIAQHQPRVVLFPHERDWNSSHIGTHLLVTDALRQMGGSFECCVIETEFWGAMDDPNAMIEMSPRDVGDMVTALTFHRGEIQRNPYHLSLPAWMMDNVRRGGELVGGQGGAPPEFTFAALCRVRKWTNGAFTYCFQGGRQVAASENIQTLLA